MADIVNRAVVNELGNIIPISVTHDHRGVTVTASGPTSEVQHTWTPAEASTLRDLLTLLLPALPALTKRPADSTYTPDPADLRSEIVDGLPRPRRLKLADAVLASLEAAGYVITTPDRLLPADAEARTEWGAKDPQREGVYPLRERANAEAAVAEDPADLGVVHRTVWVGPWLPAPTEESA